MVLDVLARHHRLPFSKIACLSLLARGTLAGREAVLAKPQTFMNNSGDAVRALQGTYGVDPADLLVLYDDLDLPFGQLRFRSSGGPGTHKGMLSIVGTLGTTEFPRLRIGIGPGQGDAADFVLSPFSRDERPELPALLDRAARGVERYLTEGAGKAMMEINPRPAGGTEDA